MSQRDGRARNGGKRSGAGRKRGSKDVKTNATAKRLLADGGKMPLDVTIYAMRFHLARHEAEIAKGIAADDAVVVAELEKAAERAKDAAPFMHPRLQAVEHSGRLSVTVEEALKELEAP